MLLVYLKNFLPDIALKKSNKILSIKLHNVETGNAFNSHPKGDKKEIDEVVIPVKSNDADIKHPDEVIIPRKDDNIGNEIPDEVVVPRNDSNESEEIPDEVVIPRKETEV